MTIPNNINKKLYNYNKTINIVTDKIIKKKKLQFKDKAMIVGIEGLSCSSKSLFSSKLVKNLNKFGFKSFSIEGDAFHQGKKKAMKVYKEILKRVKIGKGIPNDFIQKIWRENDLKNQLIIPIKRFNSRNLKETKLTLSGILKEKLDGTEHLKVYSLSKNTIILIPHMYLRQINSIDFIIYLSVSNETSIQRKIERDKSINYPRDPQVTRDMVELIESPIMQRQLESYKPTEDNSITLDINNFKEISLKK